MDLGERDEHVYIQMWTITRTEIGFHPLRSIMLDGAEK
jgi:hypothetical protein